MYITVQGPPVSEMTYTVSSGTLNSSIPYHTVLWMTPYLADHQPKKIGVHAAKQLKRSYRHRPYLLFFFYNKNNIFVNKLFIC